MSEILNFKNLFKHLKQNSVSRPVTPSRTCYTTTKSRHKSLYIQTQMSEYKPTLKIHTPNKRVHSANTLFRTNTSITKINQSKLKFLQVSNMGFKKIYPQNNKHDSSFAPRKSFEFNIPEQIRGKVWSKKLLKSQRKKEKKKFARKNGLSIQGEQVRIF